MLFCERGGKVKAAVSMKSGLEGRNNWPASIRTPSA